MLKKVVRCANFKIRSSMKGIAEVYIVPNQEIERSSVKSPAGGDQF